MEATGNNTFENKVVLSNNLKECQFFALFLLSLWCFVCLLLGYIDKRVTDDFFIGLFGAVLLGLILYFHAKLFFDVKVDENHIYYSNLLFRERKIQGKEFIKIVPLEDSLFIVDPTAYSMILKSGLKIRFNYWGKCHKSRQIKAEEMNVRIRNCLESPKNPNLV